MKQISKYQIFSELRHGPITRVYKAVQPELQRPVLVKQLNPDRIGDADLVERFKQEGLILAKINSPFVITIFDFGYDENVPFLVTEFIEGNTLAELIEKNGSLPWDIGLFILHQLAQGLMVIHHHQIIHQDVKPENIFISNDGEVKLGDLGFSASLDQLDQQIQGTPAYLSPEIVAGSRVDFRSDLYSLGLVGYEMLTGENPFASDQLATVLNRIINLKPLPVHRVNSEVPEKLSLLIAKLMARLPADRFGSAQEFAQELENLKLAWGIKVDRLHLVDFIEHPGHYQITSNVKTEPPQPVIQKSTRPKIPMLTIGIIIGAILLALLGKKISDGSGLLTVKPDSTITLQQESNNQPTDQGTDNETFDQKQERAERYSSQPAEAISTTAHFDSSIVTVPSALETRFDTLIITTDPRAFVFRDKDSLGITPLAIIFDSKLNVLEMEFQSPGFPVIKKTINTSPATAQNIRINLWKEVGYLAINVIPWGTIWIDGDSVDVTPLDRPIILTAGRHRLMVRHPTLRDITEPFYIAVGETLVKTIQLQREP